MDGPDTARGRLSILLELIRYEHGLLSGGCQAGLPGKFGYEVSDSVMSASVEAFGAACCMPPIGVKNVGTSLPPPGKVVRTVGPSPVPGIPKVKCRKLSQSVVNSRPLPAVPF